MTTKRLPFFGALLATAFALLIPLIFSALHPGYSHLRDYISELGAIGAAHGQWVTWMGFLPVGLLTALVVLRLPATLPGGRLIQLASLLFLGVSVGYLGAVIWRCDLGCPVDGTQRQQMHNLLGLVEYGLGGISLGLFAAAFWRMPSWRWLSTLSATLGVLILFALVMMATPQQQMWRGGWQRLAEVSLFGWLIVVTWWGTRRANQEASTNS